MGRVNIQGLGTVNIEGDTPNEKELEVLKRMIELRGSDQITDSPNEEVTEVSYVITYIWKNFN